MIRILTLLALFAAIVSAGLWVFLPRLGHG